MYKYSKEYTKHAIKYAEPAQSAEAANNKQRNMQEKEQITQVVHN